MPGDEATISRVTRSRRQARAAYGRLSRWYDLLSGPWEARLSAEGLRMLAVEEGQRVLEIGPGTGHTLAALADVVGAAGSVFGVDLSPHMLQVARKRLRARAALACGDASSLPLPPGSFDAVFIGFTLELSDTPEIPVVLGECWRTLRPGGHVCVVSLTKAGGRSWMRDLYEWGHRRFPSLLDCRPILVRQSLERAGFALLEGCVRSLAGLPVEIALARKR
jgi:demethylmenaquinone methyltransferase/2-methoxy-6-polyprenyl-1,4-benzoquinol methylase